MALVSKSMALDHSKRSKEIEYCERYSGGTVVMAVSTIKCRWLSVMLKSAGGVVGEDGKLNGLFWLFWLF